jgi:hypothetical protein
MHATSYTLRTALLGPPLLLLWTVALSRPQPGGFLGLAASRSVTLHLPYSGRTGPHLMDPRALAHAQYFQRNPSIQADVVMRPRIHRRILDVTCRHLQSGGGFQGQEISPKTGQKWRRLQLQIPSSATLASWKHPRNAPTWDLS